MIDIDTINTLSRYTGMILANLNSISDILTVMTAIAIIVKYVLTLNQSPLSLIAKAS